MGLLKIVSSASPERAVPDCRVAARAEEERGQKNARPLFFALGFFLFEFFIYSFPPLGSVDLGPCALLGYNASMP